MQYTVKLSKDAYKYIESLDKTTKKRIARKLQELCSDPFDLRVSKPLTKREDRTARIGDYRALFIVDEDVILVTKVGPRGEVYR